jgi:hypothetical protein
MALGPLLSLPLAYLPERRVAGLALNPVTAVGWVMALAWLAFFLATLVWFQEPSKRWAAGLHAAGVAAKGTPCWAAWHCAETVGLRCPRCLATRLCQHTSAARPLCELMPSLDAGSPGRRQASHRPGQGKHRFASRQECVAGTLAAGPTCGQHRRCRLGAAEGSGAGRGRRVERAAAACRARRAEFGGGSDGRRRRREEGGCASMAGHPPRHRCLHAGPVCAESGAAGGLLPRQLF